MIEFTTGEETFLTVPLRTIQEVLDDESDRVLIHEEFHIVQAGGEKQGTTANWYSFVLGYIYVLGGIFILSWLLVSLFRMFQLIRTGERHSYGKYQLIVISQSVSSFCWGKYIVISASDYSRQINEILLHETMHLRYRHTVDLCFMQFFLVFYWFNPVIWLLKRELQEVHEFEADNGVINTGIDTTKYQLLLVKKAVGTRLYSMANGFNHSKLKKRITMMLKERTSRWARLKLLLLVPIMGGALYAFAQPEVKKTLAPIVEETVQESQEESYWELMNFFINEDNVYQERMKGKKAFPSRIYSLHINKMNKLLFDNDYIEQEDLQKEIEERLYNSWKKNPKQTEVLLYMFDRNANEGSMGDVFRSVKNAYTNIRARIASESSNDSKAYLDSVFPILVRQGGEPKSYGFFVNDGSARKKYIEQETPKIITEVTITLLGSKDGTKKELTNFTLEDLKKEVMAVKSTLKESEEMTVGLKASKDCQMGIIQDIKQVLRECEALKINYWIN